MSFLPGLDGRILVVGDVMTDIVVLASGPQVRGSDRSAEISIVEGGSAANQAAWLAAIGVPVSLFARVGANDLEALRTQFRLDGIEPLLTGDGKRQSGRLVTLVDTDGERSFFTDRGANTALSAIDLPPDWRADAGLVVLSGYSFFEEGPRRAVMQMIVSAAETGLPVIVDAASAGFIIESGAAAFLDWTRGATALAANQDEAELLTGLSDPAAQAEALLSSYPIVIIKLGARGSLIRARGESVVSVPARPTEVVDTTGAGDAFLAGFIDAWRKGAAPEACLEAGNQLGAEAVKRVGGRPPALFGELTWC